MLADGDLRVHANQSIGGPSFLSGGGEMGARMRELDWTATALGPPASWPQSLKTIVRVMLDSRYAMWMAWGSELTFFCNDAYLPTVGIKRDWVLGARSDVVWAEIWPDIGPRIQHVLRSAEATWDEALQLFLERSGYPEETYHTFSYSPVYDDESRVAGMLCVVTEVTERVIGERRLRALRDLASRTVGTVSVEENAARIAAVLAQYPEDVPFAALYLLDLDGFARLAAVTNAHASDVLAEQLALDDAASIWQLDRLLREQSAQHIDSLSARGVHIVAEGLRDLVAQAMVLPLKSPGKDGLAGFLIAGINPRRRIDAQYAEFLGLVAGQAGSAIADARAHADERRRAEGLAALDRAKTAFFSNVSHEFRTPLTLMLGPLEDAIAGPVPPALRNQLELAYRNSLRLQKLVNSLLDFSRIEAGRVQVSYEAVDLARLTADLASTFRAAIEGAGLRYVVDCEPLPAPVLVDREMWEKIVLNLLSNAFKFTLEGEITVRLRHDGESVQLLICDTGVGVDPAVVPRLFERFFRVEGSLGRTHEGSGIGLSLVQELVKLHRGEIDVESVQGRGTSFRISIPLEAAHRFQVQPPRAQLPPVVTARAYVEEVLRWLPDGEAAGESRSGGVPSAQSPSMDARFSSTFGSRIVLADDNADMRAYLRGLLSTSYAVEAVANGEQALAAVRRQAPSLVLSDVMMPRLDGVGLVQAMRADPALQAIPVILLSARAGEESRLDGLDAGADDYLVKPFSARELLARVGALLEREKLRGIGEAQIRKREAQLQTLLDEAPIGVYLVDADFRIRQVNPTARPAFGDVSDLVGRDFVEVVRRISPPPQADEIIRLFRHTLESGESYAMPEMRERRLDRSAEEYYEWRIGRIPLPDGRYGVVCYFRDVSTQVKARRAIAEAESRLRSATLAGEVGTWRAAFDTGMDTRDASMNSLLGFAPIDTTQPMGDLMERVHAEDRERFEAAIEQLIGDGAPLDIEYRITRADGALRWFRSRGALVRDGSGAALAITGAVSDITEKRRIEQELRDADCRKDEFLAMLAHELRNPLAPVRTAAQILKLTAAGNPRLQQTSEIIERQVDHMCRIVDDLLDVSRVTRGLVQLALEPVDLRKTIAAAIEQCGPLIESRGQRLAVSVPQEPVQVRGDDVRLVQIISNLLGNASKYSDAQREISLHVQITPSDAVMQVRDRGIGISADLLPHVFDLFTQADRSSARSHGGLGLGLALVRQLVQLHGGSVQAHSDGLGLGSLFTVRLPRIAASRSVTDDRNSVPETAGESAGAKLRIMIVDDNADAAEALATLLELEGHSVFTENDALAALERARAERPPVLLLDIGLPVMDGYELATRLRANSATASSTLIALTGYGQDEDRRRSREAGFDHHLVKPVDPEVLSSLLTTLARKH